MSLYLCIFQATLWLTLGAVSSVLVCFFLTVKFVPLWSLLWEHVCDQLWKSQPLSVFIVRKTAFLAAHIIFLSIHTIPARLPCSWFNLPEQTLKLHDDKTGNSSKVSLADVMSWCSDLLPFGVALKAKTVQMLKSDRWRCIVSTLARKSPALPSIWTWECVW